MAREILFKAKRRDNGEWVEGHPHQNREHWTMWEIRKGIGTDIDPNTLC